MHVIGTAGHVDHGKSTLVKALTGIDPDRLQEEQDREMTIDLGFAWLNLPSGKEVSIVDVPGHERFIKNMLAGVGGIDLAMLIVAADESVMPQTVEHLAILDLLQVNVGLIILTKADLVEEDWLELVSEELRDTLTNTSLQNAPQLAVSALSGQGISECKLLLDNLLDQTPVRKDIGRPRLAIDRVFTMSGFGTVVTGTLLDGSLSIGQEVELIPSRLKARIRGLQSNRIQMETATPGRRLAVNLSGISHFQVQRGEVLTTPGWLEGSFTVDLDLSVSNWAPQGVKNNMGVTFFTGTSETPAKLRLLDADRLDPGSHGWVQLRLQRPIPLAKADHCIVRSSQWTLGGGPIVDFGDRTHRRHKRSHTPTLQRLEVLAKGTPGETILESLKEPSPVGFTVVVEKANLSADETRRTLSTLIAEGTIILIGSDTIDAGTFFFSKSGWMEFILKVIRVAKEYHALYPLRAGIPKEQLRNQLNLPPNLYNDILALLLSTQQVAQHGTLVHASDHQVSVSSLQAQQINAYLQQLEVNKFLPPTDLNLDPELLTYLVSEERVVKVNEEITFTVEAYQMMEATIIDYLKKHQKITVADVRDMFDTSRKYALPLMEYLDQKKITRRTGDERILTNLNL